MASSSTPDSANTSRPKGIHVATSTRKEPVEPLRRPPNPYTEALCNVAITLIEHSWHQLHHSLTDHTESHFVYYRYVDNRFTAFNRTFLKHLAIQTLIHPDFYSNPMELEPVGDMHLLGFDVDLHQRTISYIPPDAPWKIRDHASAGSARLQLSGLHSRAHLIRKYTYPSSAVERALAQLADLYVQKGHDLRSCRQALQKSLRINPLCFLAVFPILPVQSAPNAALCVCVCVNACFQGFQLLPTILFFRQLCEFLRSVLLQCSRGAVGILEVTAQRRHFKFAVICNLDADSTYLL